MAYLKAIFYGPILVLKMLLLGVLYLAYAGSFIGLAVSLCKFVPWLIDYSATLVGNNGWIFAIWIPGTVVYLMLAGAVISAIFAPLLALVKWAFTPEVDYALDTANDVYHRVTD